MTELTGLATGIGSLPHKDADEALDLIFENVPDIPFWPQLPKRDCKEGMVAQFSEKLPCLKVTHSGVVFSPENKDEELENFYERIVDRDLEYFKISPDFASGLHAFKQRLKSGDRKSIRRIKCHITGPFTFAAGIRDEKGTSLLHDEIFMQAIVKGLIMKALWQIRFLEEFGKIILFIDEPYLGCFGSAFTPLNRDDVVKGLKELTDEISASGAVQVGIHCCGNTDWSIFTDISTIGIISFDAFDYLDKLLLYADDLKRFLGRGGIICWGIVPTSDFTGKETAQLLAGRINDGINRLAKKGLDRDLLLNNLIISPACGLGTFDAAKSREIFKLLSETSSLIRKPD
jgi:methionine synthase II (cobalamin-independent)